MVQDFFGAWRLGLSSQPIASFCPFFKNTGNIWVHTPPLDCSWYWKKLNVLKIDDSMVPKGVIMLWHQMGHTLWPIVIKPCWVSCIDGQRQSYFGALLCCVDRDLSYNWHMNGDCLLKINYKIWIYMLKMKHVACVRKIVLKLTNIFFYWLTLGIKVRKGLTKWTRVVLPRGVTLTKFWRG